MELNKIYQGCALDVLKTFPDKSVHCIVTSPPYWGLRDYKVAKQKWPAVTYSLFGFEITIPEMDCCLGLEEIPQQFIGHLILIFRECNRVLRDDGTIWVNMGDSYASGKRNRTVEQASKNSTLNGSLRSQEQTLQQINKVKGGLKPKDLVGIPWMLSFALREDQWYLRSDIIWSKKNVMPESVTDRPTRAHEYIFLMSKSKSYYYDPEAIKELSVYDVNGNGTHARKQRSHTDHKTFHTNIINGMRPAGFKDASKMNGKHKGNRKSFRGGGKYTKGQSFDNNTIVENETHGNTPNLLGMRNKRDVWNMATVQFPEAHFATFPDELPETCIKAGCPENGVVLDPFMGAGTTALVASKLNRNYIGIELNSEYIKIAEKRLQKHLGFFNKSVYQ